MNTRIDLLNKAFTSKHITISKTQDVKATMYLSPDFVDDVRIYPQFYDKKFNVDAALDEPLNWDIDEQEPLDNSATYAIELSDSIDKSTIDKAINYYTNHVSTKKFVNTNNESVKFDNLSKDDLWKMLEILCN